MTARYLIGDVFRCLDQIPDGSVDLVLSSPPFLAQRAYLPADHPDKGLEIGGEDTPADFIDSLLDVVEAIRPKLAPHGTLAFELGDTYAGSVVAGGDYLPGGMREGQPVVDGSAARARHRPRMPRRAEDEALGIIPKRSHSRRERPDWPLDKSRCGIPEAFELSLSWGWNMLRPDRPTPKWRVRNFVAWAKLNTSPGRDGDKFRPSTSYMTVACLARNRYFDVEAVRVKALGKPGVGSGRPRKGAGDDNPLDRRPDTMPYRSTSEGGSPPLDWWDPFEIVIDGYLDQLLTDEEPSGRAVVRALIEAGLLDEGDAWRLSTEQYPGSHYATWPSRLCVRPIEAMCPRRVCRTCGEPSRRLVERTSTGQNLRKPGHPQDSTKQRGTVSSTDVPDYADVRTVGWSDCGHDDWRLGVVLDPFAGTGTTLAVAVGHGREAIGIDLDERNADLARDRVGIWLVVDSVRPVVNVPVGDVL